MVARNHRNLITEARRREILRPSPEGVGDLQAFVAEILITFILVFVVMAVATDDRAPAAIAPIAVGFALAVGVFIAGPVTGGAVNPARALGPMVVAGDLTSFWLYILGPIIGGVLAALLYDRFMAQTEVSPDKGLHRERIGLFRGAERGVKLRLTWAGVTTLRPKSSPQVTSIHRST
jgi:hypothetical protein